ncbi:hypothetical protein [Kaarinaea lacus]
MKKLIGTCLLLWMTISVVSAEEVTKEQIKGLDEQVQDIKKDVLSISAELNLLEEKLLYPSNTHIAFFVSVAEDADFQPDAIKIALDNKDIAHYIYSFKEVQALQKGGVQRVFTGNVRTGEHNLQVNVMGKQGGSKKTDSASHKVNKGIGPQFIEIRLSGSGIEFRDW